ncbi:MAG: DUF4421 domain-containing protein [Muribaculaceae bacterium]|nr:DUF4421 domain-containing protein [Muribaculaceae bacterium]
MSATTDFKSYLRLAVFLAIIFPATFKAAADVGVTESIVTESENLQQTNDSVEGTLLDLLVEQRLESTESLPPADTDRNWWHLLKKGELDMRDSTVEYPRFVKFCRDVYLWGDKTFNSYDTTYVVGTGTNWKARLGFDGWSDSYHINLNREMPLTMFSTPYTSAAIYLHFMAVSINQTVDLTNLCFNKPVNHKKFEFGFSCARFSLDLSFNSNTGGSYIRTFGDYNNHKIFREYFPGVNLHSFTSDLYYYFNNRKYANGASYNFSKFQKRSAGSFILGLTYSYEDIELDFTKLPEYLLPYMKVDPKAYRFNYYNYCLLLGYGYNWVLNPHILLNATVMPSVGVLHCTEQSTDGSGKLFSLNIKGRISFTYNLNNFFISFIAKADGHWYNSQHLSVFNAIENASLSLGVRF